MVGPDSKANEHVARNMAIDFCLETKCDFYLSLDGEAHLDNPRTLKLLMGQARYLLNLLRKALKCIKQVATNFYRRHHRSCLHIMAVLTTHPPTVDPK